MKKTFQTLILGLLLAGPVALMAQQATVVNNSYAKSTYTFTFGDVSHHVQTIAGQDYDVVEMQGAAPSERLGEPCLPLFAKTIEVPLCGSMTVTIDDVQTLTLAPLKNPMMPAQPAPGKSDRGPRPFVKDEAAYAADSLYHLPAAWVETLGVARDRNMALLHLSPLSYNPVSGAMELVQRITVTVHYNNADIAATETMHERYYTPEFTLGSSLLSTLPAGKEVRKDAAPIHYLIVAHSMFRGELDDFIAWKKRQGFIVTVGYTDDAAVGTTSSSIAAYTKSFYTDATDELPAPTYLLLVGDHQQIPAFTARCSSPASDHVTDLYYVSWTSGDNLPDCYVGRFSARNADELTPQVEKTIYYERYDFTSTAEDYLNKGILIAGEDGGYSGDNAYTYADPAMDYIAKTYVNAENGFTDVRYYKNNTSFAPDGVTVTGSGQTTASATALRSLYNQGYGWINYSAHGYDNCWGTPEFTTTHVNSMSNNGKPSIMIGNCCLSGKFNTTRYDACLGEALLRKDNNAGAVAYIGGTNSTYWPHDFCWSVGVRSNFSNSMNTSYDANNLGCYDRMFHTHGELYTIWHNTMGSMVYAGNKAVNSYSSNYALYYWEIYELFGDPSLMPWLSTPDEMTVEADDVLPLGTNEYIVTAVPRAYVAITTADSHDFVCAAYANRQSGVATLTLPGSLEPGQYELVVWAQNYKPYFKTINITVLDGPYLQVREVASTTGQVVPGAFNTFDVTVANLGNQGATYGTIQVSLSDSTVGCTSSELYTGAIDAGTSTTLTGALSLYVPATMQDGDVILLGLDVLYDNDAQTHKNVRLTVTAPRLAVSDVRATPVLEGGEQSTVTMRITNNGSVSTDSLTLALRHDYGFVAQMPQTVEMGVLASGDTRTASFNVTMADSLPDGNLPFRLVRVTDEGDLLIENLQIRAGLGDVEDFESNSLTTFPWSNNGDYPWEITTSEKHGGAYSVRSKSSLGNRHTSEMGITWSSAMDDSIRFWYKVSSEENYDIFSFSIDNSQKFEASGDVDWTYAAYPVSAGTHTFTFSYAKDGSRNSGSDCAYIDDITFPFSGTLIAFLTDTTCQGQSYECFGQAISTATVGTTSYANADADSLMALTVLPSPEVTIEASSDIVTGNAVILTAHGASRYEWSNGATGDVIVVYPDEPTTYTVTGFNGTCSDEASISLHLGINGTANAAPLTLYPNPAHESITIAQDGMRSVSLVNQLGQEILRREVTAPQLQLDIRNLPAGIYFIKVNTSDSATVSKIIKK